MFPSNSTRQIQVNRADRHEGVYAVPGRGPVRTLSRAELEAVAVAAHRAGQDWGTFWRHYGPHAIALEPHDRHRFKQLLRRLTALVAAGDIDGMDSASDPAPWLADDVQAAYPASDSETSARFDWQAAGIVPVAVGVNRA